MRAYTTSTCDDLPKRGVDLLHIYRHHTLAAFPLDLFQIIPKEEVKAWVQEQPIRLLRQFHFNKGMERSVPLYFAAWLIANEDKRSSLVLSIFETLKIWSNCTATTEHFGQSKPNLLYIWYKLANGRPCGYWLTISSIIKLALLLDLNFDGLEPLSVSRLDSPEGSAQKATVWKYFFDAQPTDILFFQDSSGAYRIDNVQQFRHQLGNVVEECCVMHQMEYSAAIEDLITHARAQ